ncbi:helix-turn-helix transcriptional regulator [Kutzneria kofuensis]|uniref:Putative ATPase/DNA-binding CsgD family transcriptional regulator n=1 Tax=Kutzneria kofuensis TaxID=103725 RepID=A0A7W9KG91_9PSEU|nr:LuxR C-terminal-related transcriptional regulator [Kutzneria kofuensis]MBB5891259.1 putative ATPase/DNA-binding CsgD family transcriptional regulator [Kutzneria kofuensis]
MSVTFLAAGLDPLGAVGPNDPAQASRRRLELLLDATKAAFASPEEALKAAEDLRQSFADDPQAGRLRIALHTGDDSEPTARRARHLCEIANGGQTLLSATTAAELPAGLYDLGVHRLRDLMSPIRLYAIGDDRPPRSLDQVPNNLPVQFTTFVGRQAELSALRTLLLGERLVTLAGPGGSGKTRLAAQLAANHSEYWPQGAWWVDLAEITDPALVADAVADAVGALVGSGRLAPQLRTSRLLLCLDNCEQVLDGVADLAAELLRTCPEVTVLATSREPLGIPGEAVWRVPPIATDEALALFVERARLVVPGFELDEASRAAVASMCERLDGMPLALELAAAWLRTLTPQQIEAGLDDRFSLLTRGPRGVASRQQTLAASVQWSHDLLDDTERTVFRRLAVFHGGFTLDAARAVCDQDVLVTLAGLVDKSLVVAEDGRYRLLETIREYALSRLREAGEEEAVKDRHLDYFLAYVERDSSPDKDSWRIRMQAEHGNLRAALDRGLTAGDPAKGRRLAAGLPWLWHLHGPGHEGIEYLRRAVDRAPEDTSPLQSRLLTGIALVADVAGPVDLGADALERALKFAADERDRGLPLVLQAVGRLFADLDGAWRQSLEALASAEASGDEFVRDSAFALQGIVLHLRDDHERAVPLLATSVAELLRRGDRGVAATALCFRASSALVTGDLGLARDLAEEAVKIAEPLGDYNRVGTTRSMLATVHSVTGDTEAGLRLMEPVINLVRSAEVPVFVPGMASALGSLHLARHEFAEAERWLREATLPTERVTCIAVQSLPPLAAALIGLDRCDEASALLDRAVSMAGELRMHRVLADAYEQQGRLRGDLDLHHQALAIRVEHGLRLGCVDSLDAIGALTGADHVLAAATAAREHMGYPRRAPVPAHATKDALMSLDEAVEYVRRTRGARNRPSSGWNALTPTELSVAKLAVAGLNNPEIGAKLFMSRGTVKTHLSHIFTKLGIGNRTELATVAAGRFTDDHS